MALNTYSKFYYGPEISESSIYFSFSESGAEKKASLKVGVYTPELFAIELQRALNAAGSQIYSVLFDRATKKITISANSIFGILLETASDDFAQAYSVLGFTQSVDLNGATSYQGESPCCSECCFQFPLQSYVGPDSNMKLIDAVKKKTSTGVVEAVSFGKEQLMEFEALYITNIPQAQNSVIRTNTQAVRDISNLLDFATTMNLVEFMQDESKPDEFQNYILESTEYHEGGLGWKLIEEYDEGLPDYYRTGKLTWRLRI